MNASHAPGATTPTEGETMRSLRALGFTDRTPEYASTKLGYDMGGWELSAQEMVNLSMVPIVQVSGFLHTPRRLATIDIQMLQTFEQPEMAAAFLVFGLHRHRSDLKTLPSWWAIGEANLDLHPVVQQRKQNEERMRDFRARPHCMIDIEHARLFRRQLRKVMKDLPGNDVAPISFNGQVLRVAIAGQEIAVLASGEVWPHVVSWPVSSQTKLPGRFSGEAVTVGFFEETLDLANYRYTGAMAEW